MHNAACGSLCLLSTVELRWVTAATDKSVRIDDRVQLKLPDSRRNDISVELFRDYREDASASAMDHRGDWSLSESVNAVLYLAREATESARSFDNFSVGISRRRLRVRSRLFISW